ncbi:MAG: DUF1670 domain-containing protein [Gammaproteobacteria bacterium]|nr:DUF1670 domain-containing protein [Gammaproteobacteria bacterium]
MINNSTLYRWDRLATKSLDHQFINEIVHGLNCSPFEAEAVLETVYRVFGDYFDTSENIKPGQIKLPVVSIEAHGGQRLSEAKQVTVTLTLTDDKEDLRIRKRSGVAGLRRHRIQRICQQALDQGGLLTVEDLAYRVFNCGQRTICRDLQYFRDNDTFIPLRSTVKDIGRTLSHRVLIIKHWAKGKQYSEIAKDTAHSLRAVQNYVDKFKRTIALCDAGYNVTKISFLLRLSAALVEEYIELYQQLDFVAHRQQELKDFLKKSRHPDDQEATS